MPSPKPQRVIQHHMIRDAANAGHIVIAAGGGGVPITVKDDGDYEGVEAVVDKHGFYGDPSEFAWVLPIKGTVDVGVSSDIIFNQLIGTRQARRILFVLDAVVNDPADTSGTPGCMHDSWRL